MRQLIAIFLLFLLGSSAGAVSGITPCSSNSLSVSGSTNNVQLSACGDTLILWNVGAQEGFYKLGRTSSTTAATSDNSLPSGAFVVLNVGNNQPYLAGITASSTTTFRITQGQTK